MAVQWNDPTDYIHHRQVKAVTLLAIEITKRAKLLLSVPGTGTVDLTAQRERHQLKIEARRVAKAEFREMKQRKRAAKRQHILDLRAHAREHNVRYKVQIELGAAHGLRVNKKGKLVRKHLKGYKKPKGGSSGGEA